MKNSLPKALLIIAVVFAMFNIGVVPAGAQATTSISGVINQNTTWTKANSPYNLTGDITIINNITLTIEAGVTVKLNKYSITVNGSLNARGSSNEPIYFNSTDKDSQQIIFNNLSESWNAQTKTGCIIENSVVSTTIFMNANTFNTEGINVYHVSPLINHNSLYRITIHGGEPVITNNTITGKISINQGQPKLLYNDITDTNYGSFYMWGGAPEISYNTIACGIEERGYYYPHLGHTISHNKIGGCGIDIDHHGALINILNNTVSGSGFGYTVKVIGSSSVIVNNTITGKNDIGIYVPDMTTPFTTAPQA